jgi:sigma-B regulation protein RsbU (phosphoserine phosphatase)
MLEESRYGQESVTLAPGERLYLHTDGAVEATNGAGDEFGQARLRAAIERWRDRPLREALDRIAAEVEAWCGGRLEDDLTLLALERVG